MANFFLQMRYVLKRNAIQCVNFYQGFCDSDLKSYLENNFLIFSHYANLIQHTSIFSMALILGIFPTNDMQIPPSVLIMLLWIPFYYPPIMGQLSRPYILVAQQKLERKGPTREKVPIDLQISSLIGNFPLYPMVTL